jgi:hypothetical protein
MARASEAVWTGPLSERSGTTGAMRLSDELDGWLRSDGDKTLGGLIDLFEERSFAVLFLFLLRPASLASGVRRRRWNHAHAPFRPELG